MMTRLEFIPLTVIALFVAAPARAHESWLQPERFAATPGATLLIDLAGADGFDRPDAAPEPAAVARIAGRLAGQPLVCNAPVAAEKNLRCKATLPRPGIAVFTAELAPRNFELRGDEIETRLRALHATEELRDAWSARPAPRRWREHETMAAKTFVRVGEPPAADHSWAEPLGAGLELVPERDPTALRAGDELSVRVLRGGAPVRDFVVTFASSDGLREHVSATDESGRTSAPLDAAGTWLVHGVDLRPASADHEWDSEGATMLVEVK